MGVSVLCEYSTLWLCQDTVVSTNSSILCGSSADAQQHPASYSQSLEGLVAALCGSKLMSSVLTSSLISHAAGNKNEISINQERSACGGVVVV